MISAQLTVLTGFIAGRRVPLPPEGIIAGRNEDVGFRFDPVQDLQVSGRHAAFVIHEKGWLVQDLGSLNGTYVGGKRVKEPVLLRDGDEIQLGEGGPILEFRLLLPSGEEPVRSPRTSQPRGDGRRVVVLSLLILVATAFAVHSAWKGARYRNQVMAMQTQIDSILNASAETSGALQGRIQGLHEALLESRGTLETVRSDLEAAEGTGDSQEIQALRVQLQEAQTALVRHQLAANLDYDAIEAGNRRAVAKVFVDFGQDVITATAFSVRSDGTLMTNRHVVAGSTGDRTPRRIAVQFADSRQVWPARVLATSTSVDLALLKIDNIVGEVPTVVGFQDRPGTIRSGEGVGVIGFPLGGAEATGDEEGIIARTILSAGIVQAVGQDVLEVNGYGVEGSSGSPVFDGDGRVVGVLFGGRVVDGERTLFAVPANRAAAFLRSFNPGGAPQ